MFYKQLPTPTSDPVWQQVSQAAYRMKGFFEDHILHEEKKACQTPFNLSFTACGYLRQHASQTCPRSGLH